MPWKMWSFICWLAWGCPSLWFLFYFGSWNRVNIDTSLTYRIPQKMWTFIILVAFLLQTFSDFVPVNVTICRIHLCYCFCVFSWWKDHKGQAGWGWGQPGIGEDVPAHGTPWNEMDPNHCRIPNRAPLCTDSRAAWPCQMPFWESQEIQGLWIFAWNTATPRCPRQSRQITAQCLLLAGRATLSQAFHSPSALLWQGGIMVIAKMFSLAEPLYKAEGSLHCFLQKYLIYWVIFSLRQYLI